MKELVLEENVYDRRPKGRSLSRMVDQFGSFTGEILQEAIHHAQDRFLEGSGLLPDATTTL